MRKKQYFFIICHQKNSSRAVEEITQPNRQTDVWSSLYATSKRQHKNPSGRLPITFYKSTAQLPDFLDYSMKGRTYRYMTEEPLYPFGYGLSYTDFYFSDPVLSSSTIKNGSSVRVRVNVMNAGKMDGNESVQVYVKRLNDPNAPVKALKGLKMVPVKAGETKTVDIDLPASSFEYYDAAADGLVCKSGSYRILVGGSSADKDLKGANLTIQ